MTTKFRVEESKMTLRWITQRLRAKTPGSKYVVMWVTPPPTNYSPLIHILSQFERLLGERGRLDRSCWRPADGFFPVSPF
jgi:hypothetical protein